MNRYLLCQGGRFFRLFSTALRKTIPCNTRAGSERVGVHTPLTSLIPSCPSGLRFTPLQPCGFTPIESTRGEFPLLSCPSAFVRLLFAIALLIECPCSRLRRRARVTRANGTKRRMLSPGRIGQTYPRRWRFGGGRIRSRRSSHTAAAPWNLVKTFGNSTLFKDRALKRRQGWRPRRTRLTKPTRAGSRHRHRFSDIKPDQPRL